MMQQVFVLGAVIPAGWLIVVGSEDGGNVGFITKQVRRMRYGLWLYQHVGINKEENRTTAGPRCDVTCDSRAAAGIGALGLSGGFEAPEMEPPPDPFGMGGQSGFDLLAADPQAYRVFYAGAPYNLGGRPYGAAEGGSTSDFPRRDGAIAGPGTEKSDDIPAMLSDGEFVMTAQAVRGAGNGSRNQGVKKMYEIMRTYEGAA